MRKFIGVLSLVTCALTALWLVLLVVGRINSGPATTFEQVLANVARLDAFYYAGYINAALITLSATMLLGALSGHFKHEAPAWAHVSIVFVPAYCVLNLVVYLAQITLVPNLLAAYHVPEYQTAAVILLREAIQQYPDSTMSFMNNLAYALLGIPSLVLGGLLLNHGPEARLAGAFLALSGVTCILGVVGSLFDIPLLEWGSIAGGVLFLLALIPLALAFLEQDNASIRDIRFEARLHLN